MKIIAGPCQHESLDMSMKIADHCARVCSKYNIEYYFKASYDKANRTSINSKRGVGIDRTMKDFSEMKKEIIGLNTLTDVHERNQVIYIEENFTQSVDVLQVPAFLCRQTDLIFEICKTDKIINIKKGQFLAPWDVAGIISKTGAAKETWITERGTSFGYNNLVVDFSGIQYMLATYNVPIFYDVTHSVQKPGGLGSSSGGNREYVPGLARAASALGVSNFFFEVHPDPDNAPSDGPNMIRLEDFEKMVDGIVQFHYNN